MWSWTSGDGSWFQRDSPGAGEGPISGPEEHSQRQAHCGRHGKDRVLRFLLPPEDYEKTMKASEEIITKLVKLAGLDKK